MKRLLRLISLCAVLLALATPAVSACDAFAATAKHCTMPAMSGMSGMSGMEMAGCHDTSVTSNECCGVRSVPESVAALSNKTATLFSAVDAGERPRDAPPPDTRPALTRPADAGCLNGLGRYALFSSLLL
jgi:hypothetical protein